MMLAYSSDRGTGAFYMMLRGGFNYTVAASYAAMPTQVTAGGAVFSHGGNNAYQRWPVSTTTADSAFASTITNMG
jgi:hypothetical protein